MNDVLSPTDLAMIQGVPASDLIALAADFDLVPDAEIDRAGLVAEVLPRMLDRVRAEGVPLSKYDAEDVAALPPPLLGALARLQGCAADPAAILKAGDRVYRQRQRQRGRRADPYALMVPMLLTPLLRLAAAADA